MGTLSSRKSFTCLGTLVLALLACKQGDTEKATASSASVAPAAAPSATPAPEAPEPETPEPKRAAKPDVNEKGVPAIPETKSDPPKGSEWDDGIAVNTQGAGSQAKDCTLMVLREWLQVTCRGKVTGYEKMDGFGTKNVDYFESFIQGQHGSFVVRLKKGKYPKVRICRGDSFASLFVSWPASAERPKHIALAQLNKPCGS